MIEYTLAMIENAFKIARSIDNIFELAIFIIVLAVFFYLAAIICSGVVYIISSILSEISRNEGGANGR